jgi:peptidoglycan/LPS O-acetylase OafA/YrhL
MLITTVAYGPQIRLLTVLDTRPLRYLGRVSYSFYLLHPLTLIALSLPAVTAFCSSTAMPPGILAACLLPISAAFAAGLAGISYALVERPGIAAGQALLRQFQPRPAAAPALPSNLAN